MGDFDATQIPIISLYIFISWVNKTWDIFENNLSKLNIQLIKCYHLFYVK